MIYKMEKLLSNALDWFITWKLFFDKNVDFIISEEVFEKSNARYPNSYMMDLFNYVIKKKLEKNFDLEKLLNNLILVVAHGKSNEDWWTIYAREDDKWVKIEKIIKQLPKNKKILLYVCNSWWYKINLDKYSIIYPKTNTWVDDLKFNVQWKLFESLWI